MVLFSNFAEIRESQIFTRIKQNKNKPCREWKPLQRHLDLLKIQFLSIKSKGTESNPSKQMCQTMIFGVDYKQNKNKKLLSLSGWASLSKPAMKRKAILYLHYLGAVPSEGVLFLKVSDGFHKVGATAQKEGQSWVVKRGVQVLDGLTGGQLQVSLPHL